MSLSAVAASSSWAANYIPRGHHVDALWQEHAPRARRCTGTASGQARSASHQRGSLSARCASEIARARRGVSHAPKATAMRGNVFQPSTAPCIDGRTHCALTQSVRGAAARTAGVQTSSLLHAGATLGTAARPAWPPMTAATATAAATRRWADAHAHPRARAPGCSLCCSFFVGSP